MFRNVRPGVYFPIISTKTSTARRAWLALPRFSFACAGYFLPHLDDEHATALAVADDAEIEIIG